MNLVSFSCILDTTDATFPLSMEILFNKKSIFSQQITQQVEFNHQFEDLNDQENQLEFVMTGKLPEHTVIDDDGNIVSSPMLTIANVKFENIELGHVFLEKAKYYHNYNGSADDIEDLFFGSMGCNGSVSFKFTTPLFLWLLENV